MTSLCISIVNRALDKMRKEVIFMNRRILAADANYSNFVGVDTMYKIWVYR